MPNFNPTSRRNRSGTALLLFLPALLLTGCSQDVASVDDRFTPMSTQDRHPIRVTDKTAKMTVDARSGRMTPEQVNRVASFARAAGGEAGVPVLVSYPAGSAKARAASAEAIAILANQGVPRHMIQTASYNGKADVVRLSFTRRVATTDPCGAWPENVAANQYNELHTDFGCSMQNNMAAMVADPQDFERMRRMDPALAAARSNAMETYGSGKWCEAPKDTPTILDLFR